MLCVAFLLLVAWVRATFPEHHGSTLCFSGQFITGGASSQVNFRTQKLRTTVEAANVGENQVGQQIWWVKMNNYQQQVWALSNALAGLLRDSEASKFPATLRAKTMELQQSCNGLEQYISTSTSRIQKDVRDCVEDLKDIVPSSQQPARLCRKLASVEDYLLSIRQLLQTQESRAQDLEYDIQSLEDDFSSLQREAAETTKGYELGVKVFAVCAVVAFAAVALPAIAGSAAVAEGAAAGAALTAGSAAEGAVVAAGTAAVAEGAAVAGTAATAAAVEGAAAASISAETVAILSGGAALALKGGADGCRQLVEFLDRQQRSVSEHRGFVRQLQTEIDVIKDDISNLHRRLEHATDALKDDDVDDATKIVGRLAERLGELV